MWKFRSDSSTRELGLFSDGPHPPSSSPLGPRPPLVQGPISSRNQLASAVRTHRASAILWRRRAYWLRFAEQQANLLRHDHIPVDTEFETAARTFQSGLKYLLGYWKSGTTDGDGSSRTSRSESARTLGLISVSRAQRQLTPEKIPTQAKEHKERLGWATGPDSEP